jgi:hypothetical protein
MTSPADESPGKSRGMQFDNPLERLELVGDDDEAIAAFLDDLDVRSPREREMLAEIARPRTIARPERLVSDHRRAVTCLESLRRHGFHGSRVASSLGPLRPLVRYFVELVARYIVVSYVKTVVLNMRNLYWLREIEAEDDSRDLKLIRPLRMDAESLVVITRSREIGIPTFLIGALLIPLAATLYRLATGFAFASWQAAVIVGASGILIGLAVSWVVLRGTAMASRRIRLSVRDPLEALWFSVGNCGQPPKDQSRKFAIVSISLTVGVWIILPSIVGIAIAR